MQVVTPVPNKRNSLAFPWNEPIKKPTEIDAFGSIQYVLCHFLFISLKTFACVCERIYTMFFLVFERSGEINNLAPEAIENLF